MEIGEVRGWKTITRASHTKVISTLSQSLNSYIKPPSTLYIRRQLMYHGQTHSSEADFTNSASSPTFLLWKHCCRSVVSKHLHAEKTSQNTYFLHPYVSFRPILSGEPRNVFLWHRSFLHSWSLHGATRVSSLCVRIRDGVWSWGSFSVTSSSSSLPIESMVLLDEWILLALGLNTNWGFVDVKLKTSPITHVLILKLLPWPKNQFRWSLVDWGASRRKIKPSSMSKTLEDWSIFIRA